MRREYRQTSCASKGVGLSRNDLVLCVTTRCVEAFFGSLVAIVLALSCEVVFGAAIGNAICPGVGTLVGVVVGCVVGGVADGLVGRACGHVVGNFIARSIVATFKTDDRAVALDDIQPGDHLVFYKKLLHPRCHAVAIGVNKERKCVTVIKNTFSRGVVKEDIPFKEPVYRVSYKDKIKTYPKETIVERAHNALTRQHSKYNIFTYNCKHFAYDMIINKHMQNFMEGRSAIMPRVN
jgi:hypothetical protein